jgi:leucyl-tRNA synthetase
MYTRFFTKALYDLGMIDFTEPFERLLNQGQVINQGKAMSKTLGNGIDLGEQIDAYGVDAVRLTMLFAGPPDEDIDWADMSAAASQKFLARAHRVMSEVASEPGVSFEGGDVALRRVTHKTIDEVTRLVESYRFNVAIARMMELTNAARKAIDSGPGAADPAVREAAEALAIMLSIIAPYVTEEGWETLGHSGSIVRAGWPVALPELLVQDSVTCVVQVTGKVRDRLEVSPSISAEELEKLALASDKVQAAIDGGTIRKIVVRAPKIVNIVV